MGRNEGLEEKKKSTKSNQPPPYDSIQELCVHSLQLLAIFEAGDKVGKGWAENQPYFARILLGQSGEHWNF